MYDLIIVGGGPAGLTAAVYAVRKRLNVLLISQDLGGKSNYHTAVEGQEAHQVINGADIVRRFRSEVEYLDFARVLEKVTSLARQGMTFAVTTESGRQLEARAVILATGADAIRLHVPGADRYALKGVMYSTVSYAPLFVDKQVAVIGSGRLALRGAGELAQIARQVYLVAPEPGELAGSLGRRVQETRRISLLEGWQPVAVDGDSFARELHVKSPNGEERSLKVDAIFVELGLQPRSELVRGLADLNEEGHVIVNCSTQTSVPGLFAAGDVSDMPAEQVLIAIGDGAKATLSAFDYLLQLESATHPVA